MPETTVIPVEKAIPAVKIIPAKTAAPVIPECKYPVLKNRITVMVLLVLFTAMAFAGPFAPDALQHVLVVFALLALLKLVNGKKPVVIIKEPRTV